MSLVEHEALPPDMLLDESNPGNDRYFTQLRELRALAVNQSNRMRPQHVQIVKLALQSHSSKEIAKRTRRGMQTVQAVLRRDDAHRLKHILELVHSLTAGPNLEVRTNMLWRIAARNESTDPGISIQALKELSKLAGSYPVQQTQPITAISVTINEKSLPRTELDAPLQ